jgi:hypothetical protein
VQISNPLPSRYALEDSAGLTPLPLFDPMISSPEFSLFSDQIILSCYVLMPMFTLHSPHESFSDLSQLNSSPLHRMMMASTLSTREVDEEQEDNC